MIKHFNGTLRGTTTLGQCRPGSNGTEEVVHIPQSSKTKTSASVGLVPYPEFSLGWGSYLSVEMLSALFYSMNRQGFLVDHIMCVYYVYIYK